VILVDNIEFNSAEATLPLGKIKKMIAPTPPVTTTGRNDWDVKIKK
jgi:hypothetical protein